MKVLKVLGIALAVVVLGLVAIVFTSDPEKSADLIQTLSNGGKTLHVVTIGSRGAFSITTSPKGSEIETLGRRYSISHNGAQFLLDGTPLDMRSGSEFSLILHKDGHRELKPGKH
jgi:hypothetical protein